MTSLEDRKSALLNRWKELDHRLHDIEDTLEAPHSNDWEELAVEREGDEVLEGLGATAWPKSRRSVPHWAGSKTVNTDFVCNAAKRFRPSVWMRFRRRHCAGAAPVRVRAARARPRGGFDV